MRAHLYIAEPPRPAGPSTAADPGPVHAAASALADAVETFLIYGSEENAASLHALEAALDVARRTLDPACAPPLRAV